MASQATLSTYNNHYKGDGRGVRMIWSSARGVLNDDVTGTIEIPARDRDNQPVYIASAIGFEGGVHPCKLIPYQGDTHCRVSYGEKEVPHHGEYELLRFDQTRMQWVKSSGHGNPPPGRQPVMGGYENDSPLYHARFQVKDKNTGQMVIVPGKTGPHISCACAPYNDSEQTSTDYEILCWI